MNAIEPVFQLAQHFFLHFIFILSFFSGQQWYICIALDFVPIGSVVVMMTHAIIVVIVSFVFVL
jgi:hypothetical protein